MKDDGLSQYVRFKVLGQMYGSSGDDGDIPQTASNVQRYRNVCALITPALFDELDDLCSHLNISKRRFIELSLVSGLAKADSVIEEEGLFEFFRAQQEGRAAVETALSEDRAKKASEEKENN